MSSNFGADYDAGNAWIPRDGRDDLGEGDVIVGGAIDVWSPLAWMLAAIIVVVICILYYLTSTAKEKEMACDRAPLELCERADVPRSVYYMLQERFRSDGVLW